MSLEGLESSGVVVGVYEQIKVSAQLFVVVIMVAFDGGFLDCPVHALDLAAIRENSPPDCFLVLLTPLPIDLDAGAVDQEVPWAC